MQGNKLLFKPALYDRGSALIGYSHIRTKMSWRRFKNVVHLAYRSSMSAVLMRS